MSQPSAPAGDPAGDEVLASLDALVAALRESVRAHHAILRRARYVTESRRRGRSYRDTLGREERPVTVELLAADLARVQEAGSALLLAQARSLRAEGAPWEEVAAVLGLPRRQVSALLGASDPARSRGRSRAAQAPAAPASAEAAAQSRRGASAQRRSRS